MATIANTATDSDTAPGDRSNMPAESQPTYEILSSEMQRIKSIAPAAHKDRVENIDRRLNQLFDVMNNDDLKAEHVVQLRSLADSVRARDHERAIAVHADLKQQVEGAGPWMVSHDASWPWRDVS